MNDYIRKPIREVLGMFPEGTPARAAADAMREPLVSPERAHEIRQFQIDMAELQARYGLRLESGDDHTFEIVDTRRDMPKGYTFSAIIREDGRLEVIEWVNEE